MHLWEEPHREEVMLVAGPVVGVGEPERGPNWLSFEKLCQFTKEWLLASKQLDKTLGIMGGIEPVVPCITFYIVVGEDVDFLE
jgi:hypothetical protein